MDIRLTSSVREQNVIRVAKGGGDFNVIQDAIDSIQDNSSDNRYVIRLAPGLYEENVVMKPYVSIKGEGNATEAVIRSTSGTTLTLASDANLIFFVDIQSRPTADGGVCISAPNGGRHDFISCFMDVTSATNGITGQLLSLSSDSFVTISENVASYSMTGSAVGTKTHNVVELQGSSSLIYTRSEITTTVSDVDDDVNVFLCNATGFFANSLTQVTTILDNASYTGTTKIINHTKTPSLILDVHSLFQGVGVSGTGSCIGIFVNSDTNDCTVNSNYNIFDVSGFGSNIQFETGTGDVINSEFDSVVAVDGVGAANGEGTINFFGSFAYGQLETTSGGLFTIDTTNEWHAFPTPVPQANPSNAIVTQGQSGSITAYADAGGGQVTVTSASHGLENNEYITITGTTNYNDVYQVTNVTTNTFEITETFAGDDATGTFNHGSHIKVEQRGQYRFSWSYSAAAAGNNKAYDFAFFNGTTEVAGTKLQRKFGVAGDVGIGSSSSIAFLERGDVIWFAIRNIGDTTNITLSEGTIAVHKIS